MITLVAIRLVLILVTLISVALAFMCIAQALHIISISTDEEKPLEGHSQIHPLFTTYVLKVTS